MLFLEPFLLFYPLEISSSRIGTNEEKPGLEPIVCIAVSMPLKLSSIARLYERCALERTFKCFWYSVDTEFHCDGIFWLLQCRALH